MKRMLMVFVGMLILAAASPASACADNLVASSERFEIHSSHKSWTPELVRDAATWFLRLEALLPADVNVLFEHGFLTIKRAPGASQGQALPLADEGREVGSLTEALDVLAEVFEVPKNQIARVQQLEAKPLTIQLAASQRREDIERLVDKLNAYKALEQINLHGFFNAGGYDCIDVSPMDCNSFAHIVSGVDAKGMPVHRLMVGGFLTRASAQKALARLQAHGFKGFVRTL